MAHKYTNGNFVGMVDTVGKGDRQRPNVVSKEEVDQHGAKTFGEDWLEPPILRRRRQAKETK